LKSIVIYYSMTGNTRKIAQAIQAGIVEGGIACDLARLKDVKPSELGNYDLVGLGSPVINQQEPPNITGFIRHAMAAAEGKHGFVFCTHGATPCRFLSSVVPTLKQGGLTVIGWHDWFGSAYYPAIPKPYLTDGHPDEIDMKEAEAFGRKMAELSRWIYGGETGLIPEFPTGQAYDKLYEPPEIAPRAFPEVMAYGELMHRSPFQINIEKCVYPKCTHCIDNCPAHNIGGTTKWPVFYHNCAYCYLCEQTCPRAAIEIDWVPLEKAHYELVRGWLRKSVEFFESQGRFRRLVRYEDLGWNTPFWKNKPPRFHLP
jgi:NAD-dependent dihydropyrimidine dehydrogenase PreA subunit